MTDTNDPAADSEPELVELRIHVCRPCIDGKPGECHAPGCFYWMHRAEEVPTHLAAYVAQP